jgi:cytochrome c-type biogenesis protein CcmE
MTAGGIVVAGPTARRSAPRRRWPALLGIAVIVATLVYLVRGGIGDNLVYFLTPTELLAKGAAIEGAPVRLGGMIEPGTVHWDSTRRELHFRLRDETHAVTVVSVGLPPQMFAEGTGAVVEGVYVSDGVFHSHNLMVKHSNTYRAAAPGTQVAASYRRLFGSGAAAP